MLMRSRRLLATVSIAALLGTAVVVSGPTKTFDFTLGTFPSDVTFSRTTQGTYFNSSGVLTLAAIDVPRLDYDASTLAAKGLLIEPAATNLCLYSQDFSNASWGTYADGSASIAKTANADVAPDGTTTAGKVDINRSDTSHFAEVYVTYTGTATAYTHSLWFKAYNTGDIGKKLMLACFNGTGASGTIEITLTASWKRETITGTMSAASCQLNIGYLSAAGFPGTSNPTGACSFYIWGGQVETGSTATSYIPTTSATVTRAADAASITIPGGVTRAHYIFDDNSTQDVTVSAGAYSIPTNLNRARIKTLELWPT
jgi:hypothetical protein